MQIDWQTILLAVGPTLFTMGVTYQSVKSSLTEAKKSQALSRRRELWVYRLLQQIGTNHNALHPKNTIELNDYPEETDE